MEIGIKIMLYLICLVFTCIGQNVENDEEGRAWLGASLFIILGYVFWLKDIVG